MALSRNSTSSCYTVMSILSLSGELEVGAYFELVDQNSYGI